MAEGRFSRATIRDETNFFGSVRNSDSRTARYTLVDPNADASPVYSLALVREVGRHTIFGVIRPRRARHGATRGGERQLFPGTPYRNVISFSA